MHELFFKSVGGDAGILHNLTDKDITKLQTLVESADGLLSSISSIQAKIKSIQQTPSVGIVVPICSSKSIITYTYISLGNTYTATFLLCDGGTCVTYPELYSLLGVSTLPNYRGVFLRGYGSQTVSQDNGTTVGTTETTHTSGGLGDIQGDATRLLYGTFAGGGTTGIGNTVNAALTGTFGYSKAKSTAGFASAPSKTAAQAFFDSARTVPTDVENRPVNVAVNYYICASTGQ